jgi:hypothetical protein
MLLYATGDPVTRSPVFLNYKGYYSKLFKGA